LSNNSRTWVLMSLIGVIVIGGVLIALPLLAPSANPIGPTPIPTALNIDQNIPYPAVPRINVSDAHTAWQARQAVLVDVRSASQYAQRHVPGAKLMPLGDIESRLNELNKDQAIITYCT
jgi:hypothetical protein